MAGTKTAAKDGEQNVAETIANQSLITPAPWRINPIFIVLFKLILDPDA
jgi:hypothetical protein